MHPAYNQDTARIQSGCCQGTARIQPGYSRIQPGYSQDTGRIQLLNFTPNIILYFAIFSHPFANILPFNIHFSLYFSFLFHISPFLS
jgi:hypothetical protein